jgi:probable HAF family extracellular repeat protein
VPGIHRNTVRLLSALVMCGLIAASAQADAIFSVTDLGAASPSVAYLSGQSQLDPSGNYLSALSASQQAAFQQGSFDVYAHPATANNIYSLEFYLPGGDVVRTDWQDGNALVSKSWLVTSNNLGTNAGTAETSYTYATGSTTNIVLFTPDPHTAHDSTTQTSTQSPGYLSSIPVESNTDGGQFLGKVAGINDHGVIATTQSMLPGTTTTPYLYASNSSSQINLGNLGGANGVANALNNSNQVVGWSQIASGAQHAFLYSNGTLQDLNLLIPPLAGITLTSAVGIDAAGDIVAYGTNASGQSHEYLLTPAESPVPEPSSLAGMTLAIAALAIRQFRHRAKS